MEWVNWYVWLILLVCVICQVGTAVLLRLNRRLSKDIDRKLRLLRAGYDADSETARLNYMLDTHTRFTRDSIDAAMDWTSTEDDANAD